MRGIVLGLVFVGACSTNDHGATSNLPGPSEPLSKSEDRSALPFGGDVAACEADTDAMWDREIPTVGIQNSQYDAFDGAIRAIITKYGLPGLGVYAFNGTGAIIARGYGFADRSSHELMTPEHAVRLGALGRLALMSILDGEIPVTPVIQGNSAAELGLALPNVPPSLGIADLYAGTEGWDDADVDPWTLATPGISRDALLGAALANGPARNPPGKVTKPSHVGDLLLATMVEKKYGKSLEEIVSANTDFVLSHTNLAPPNAAEARNAAPDTIEVSALGTAAIAGSVVSLVRLLGGKVPPQPIVHAPGATIVAGGTPEATIVGSVFTNAAVDPAQESAFAAEVNAAIVSLGSSEPASVPLVEAWTPWASLGDVTLSDADITRSMPTESPSAIQARFTDKLELRTKLSRNPGADPTLYPYTYGASCPAFRQRYDALANRPNKYALLAYQTFTAADGHRRYQAVWARTF